MKVERRAKLSSIVAKGTNNLRVGSISLMLLVLLNYRWRGWGWRYLYARNPRDKLDVALKILRTLQAVGMGCFWEYLDVPTAKRRYDDGTVREMREQVGGFQCLFEIAFRVPVLRCDAAGGGEGAGIREDGRVPGVHGEGVRRIYTGSRSG